MREFDTDYTNEIVCPWCGYKFADSWEFDGDNEDLGLIKCEDCGKAFYATRNISIDYSTEKAIYGTCPVCGEKETVLSEEYSTLGYLPPMCEKCFSVERKKLMSEYFKQMEARNG